MSVKKLDLSRDVLGETSASDDHNLAKYYVDFGRIKDLRERSVFMALGPKGAGKTALKEYLTTNKPSPGDVVIDIDRTPYRISFEELARDASKDAQRKLTGYLIAVAAAAIYDDTSGNVDKLKLRQMKGRIALYDEYLSKSARPTFQSYVTGIFNGASSDLDLIL